MSLRRVFADSNFHVEHYAVRSASPPHAHADYVLTYQLRGITRCRIGSDRILQFHPGDVNLLNPGEVHKDFCSTQERECLTVGICIEFFQDLFGALGRRGPTPPSFPYPKLKLDAAIQPLCHAIRVEVDGQQFGREVLLRSLVTEFVFCLLRQMSPSALGSELFGISSASARCEVGKAIDYLRDTFQDKFELEHVAKVAGLSKYHLERVFKKATGMHLHTYAMSLRIDRAKQLLSSINKPILDIALELGFSDQSHFTNAFKRFTGTSPRSYRSRHAH